MAVYHYPKIKRKYRIRENTCTTLQKVYDYATTTYAKRTAYQFVDGGEEAYTFASFREKCDLLSMRMSRYGIKAGDKVDYTISIFSRTF